MNVIAFGTKRVFHGFLRVTRRALLSLGLTAARFDMLQAINGSGNERRGLPILQSELRLVLGVTAGVVSRMVRALERLGWVERRRDGRDGRQWRLALTEMGRACLRGARRLLLKGVQRMVDHAISGRRADRNKRFMAMLQLESWLDVLRQHFGDRATLYYAWGHPDD